MAEGKGLSKGCMVGLIVAGIIVVVGLVVVALGYIFWDDIIKMGSGAMAQETKRLVAANPPEGVDTTEVNALMDSFAVRFAEDEDLTVEEYGPILQSIEQIIKDEQVTANEWAELKDQILLLYPELESELPAAPPGDEMMTDSAAVLDSM